MYLSSVVTSGIEGKKGGWFVEASSLGLLIGEILKYYVGEMQWMYCCEMCVRCLCYSFTVESEVQR